MIDTIKLTSRDYNKTNWESNKKYQRVVKYGKSGKSYYQYSLRNFTIILTDSKITISGSLTKYILGHNINLSIGSIKDVKDAFKKLSIELGIDLSEFTISRLDFGRCFILPSSISNYLTSLNSLARHDFIYYQGTGRNFTNTIRTIKFYDKIAEIKSLRKKKRNSELRALRILGLEKKNILRYEIQITDPTKHFKQSLKVKDILDYYSYEEKILQKYFHFYNLIEKNCLENLDFTGKTPKKILDLMSYHGIQYYGNEKFFSEMKNMKEANPEKRRNFLNLKDKIRDIKKESTLSNNMLDNLTKQIENSADLPILDPNTNHLFDDEGLLVDFLADLVLKQRQKDPDLKLPQLSQEWNLRDFIEKKADDTDIALIIREEIQKIKEITKDKNGIKKYIQEDGLRNAIYLMKYIKSGEIPKLGLIDFLNKIMNRCRQHE